MSIRTHIQVLILLASAFFSSIVMAQNASGAQENKRSANTSTLGESGNPLPRFVSLAAHKAYMRTGPGRQYPVAWVYKRHGLPLEVIAEHRSWRHVRDHENITGWMHVSLLSSKRTAMIMGRPRKLYSDDDQTSDVAFTAAALVIGHIKECGMIWCELEIDRVDGWVERRHLFGLLQNEQID